jgi:hypothetical protein
MTTRLMFFDPSHATRQSQYVELVVDLAADQVRAVLAGLGPDNTGTYAPLSLTKATTAFVRATECDIDFTGLPTSDYVEWLTDFGPRAIDPANAETIAWDVRAWRELVAPSDAQHYIPV